MAIVWKKTLGGYYGVSNLGDVRRMVSDSNRTFVGRLVKQGTTKHGYKYVQLYVKKKRYVKYVHVLVARTFFGPCPPGHEVNHKDTVKSNCRLSNLEYLTHIENMEHAVRSGVKFGGKNNRRYSDMEVKAVRSHYKVVKSYSKVAADLNVGYFTVYNIVNGRNWSSVR
jgi:hypothetical protein